MDDSDSSAPKKTKSAPFQFGPKQKFRGRLADPHKVNGKTLPPIDSPYVRPDRKDWQLDMTPVNEILTPEGLAILPPHMRDLPVRRIPSTQRSKVGLVRKWDVERMGTLPGHPAGYIPIGMLYQMVQVLPYEDILRLQEGKAPLDESWPKTRKVTGQWVRVAQEVMSAGKRGVPQEINNRTDGVLAQEVRSQSVSFVVEIPAVLSPDDWQRQARLELGPGEQL